MTAPMFQTDQATNDRLLLQEVQRRQELIDTAITSFAPQLAGKPDVSVIHLHSTNASLRKAIRDMFEGARVIVVEHCRADGRDRKGRNEVQHEGVYLPLPPTADLVITKSNQTSKTELLAAHLKALPLVLPEGEEYLRKRLERAGVLVLVGAEQGKQ